MVLIWINSVISLISWVYTLVVKSLEWTFFYVFERNLFCSLRKLKYNKNIIVHYNNIVNYYFNLKELFSILIYFKWHYFCDGKAEFSAAIIPVFI